MGGQANFSGSRGVPLSPPSPTEGKTDVTSVTNANHIFSAR